MKVSKLLFALSLTSALCVSFAASAEINVDDSKNVSYGNLAINADGSVLVGGSVVKKCDWSEDNKVTKAKLATVTCDVNYITVKDKKGDSLTRFSEYALATAKGGVEERKELDPALAAMGSASSGDSARTVTETQTLTAQSINKTVVTPDATQTPPAKPPVNETNYIPKLGVDATNSPEVRNDERIGVLNNDKKEENFVNKQQTDPAAPPPLSVTVKTIETPPTVTETTKTTTIAIPADGGQPVSNTQTDSKVISSPSQAPAAGQ